MWLLRLPFVQPSCKSNVLAVDTLALAAELDLQLQAALIKTVQGTMVGTAPASLCPGRLSEGPWQEYDWPACLQGSPQEASTLFDQVTKVILAFGSQSNKVRRELDQQSMGSLSAAPQTCARLVSLLAHLARQLLILEALRLMALTPEAAVRTARLCYCSSMAASLTRATCRPSTRHTFCVDSSLALPRVAALLSHR